MLQKKVEESTYHFFYPFFLILFLTTGAIIAEYVAKNQNFQSHTEVLGTTTKNTNNLPPSTTAIDLKVKIEGIGEEGNKKPTHTNREITVLAYEAGTQFITSGSAQLSYDNNNYFTGRVHLDNVTSGLYFVKVIEKGLLTVTTKPQLQKLLRNQKNTIPLVRLLPGDITNDGVLNHFDFALVLSCFQNHICSTNAEDFNDDGKIDINDFNLFMQSYNAFHEN